MTLETPDKVPNPPPICITFLTPGYRRSEFLDDSHLANYDLGSLPPPGMSTSSLTVEVDPETLDELAHDARETGRTIPQVIQDRLRGTTAA